MARDKYRKRYIIISVLCIAAIIVGTIIKNEVARKKVDHDNLEITFAHFQGEGDAMYHSIENAIYLFEKDNPNVKIKQEYYTTDAYAQKTEEWNEEREIRDITMVLGTMVPEYAENGSILDLTEYISKNKINRKIDSEYFGELSYHGQIYGVPWEKAHYAFILYNEEIFQEVGISKFPTTLDEFVEACTKLNRAGYIPMGMGNKQGWGLDSLLFSAFVNNYVGNEWYDDILACNGEASFLDEEFLYALEDFQKLGRVDAFNSNFASINNEQRGNMYQNREVAMISAGNWECRSTAELVPEIAEMTKVALWPAGKQAILKQSLVSSSAWGMAVGAGAEKEKIPYIIDFINHYICSQEFGQILAEEQGVFTPWKVEYDSSTINVLSQQVEDIAKEKETQTCLNWDSTLPTKVKKVYQQGLEDITLGIKSPKLVAEEIQKVYEKMCK